MYVGRRAKKDTPTRKKKNEKKLDGRGCLAYYVVAWCVNTAKTTTATTIRPPPSLVSKLSFHRCCVNRDRFNEKGCWVTIHLMNERTQFHEKNETTRNAIASWFPERASFVLPRGFPFFLYFFLFLSRTDGRTTYKRWCAPNATTETTPPREPQTTARIASRAGTARPGRPSPSNARVGTTAPTVRVFFRHVTTQHKVEGSSRVQRAPMLHRRVGVEPCLPPPPSVYLLT